LTRRSRREDERRFLAEGPPAVREALRRNPSGPGGVEALFCTEDAADRHVELVAAATDAGVGVHLVTAAGMTRLSETVHPQGLVAVCRFLDVPLGAALERRPPLVVVLVEVNEPGNAGAILRSAAAAGASAVVLTDGSVDPYNGKCVRASAGSLFHVDVVRGGEPVGVIRALRDAGLRVLAADAAGAADLDVEAGSGRLAGPTAWVFGNEARGLPDQVGAAADERVRIPLRGGPYGVPESLNLAAAVAVCLYATARQQHPIDHRRRDTR